MTASEAAVPFFEAFNIFQRLSLHIRANRLGAGI